MKKITIRCSNEKESGIEINHTIVFVVYLVCRQFSVYTKKLYVSKISISLEWNSERGIIIPDINQKTKSNPFHHDLCA